MTKPKAFIYNKNLHKIEFSFLGRKLDTREMPNYFHSLLGNVSEDIHELMNIAITSKV